MVDDNVVAILHDIKAVGFPFGDVSGPETHIPDDHVMRPNAHLVSAQADSIPGRSLTRDGQERLADDNRRLERDESADPEDHRSRTLRRNSFPKAARPRVVEIPDEDGFSIPSSGGFGSKSFCSRKCHRIGL